MKGKKINGMKRIFAAYKELIGIIYVEAPIMVIITFIATILNGLLAPFSIYIHQNIFDGGLAVAMGELSFAKYSVYLILFVVVAILPTALNTFIFSYVRPRSLLILRTAYKSRMLQKLKTMKYEHFENETSAEIIDKAYHRAEYAATSLWPMYVYWFGGTFIANIGTLIYIFKIKWWLLLTILIPFVLNMYLSKETYAAIYTEMETYWKKERKYGVLGSYLRSRAYTKELKAYENYDYLIDVYKDRMQERNQDYERYYFKNLKRILLSNNIIKLATLLNVILLLLLFANGQISVGLFIAVSGVMFGSVYSNLDLVAGFFKWSGIHINTYEYYDKFFDLSDESKGAWAEFPAEFDIEFKDVWFRYPGTEKDILKGVSFCVKPGEKISLIGENGEGKSTLIKLLLGLFTPDRGEIHIGGKNLTDYPPAVRAKIFGFVFQDFPKYNITVKENIGIGDIDAMENLEQIKEAAYKGKADQFAEQLENGYDTLLGREFDNGVDLSGGQWQRIAIARAFMGNKPILLLDEPTSQLDPMAEAELYKEFSDMVDHKTAIFITHRLGSTAITDRIFVLSEGTIKEQGTHDALLEMDGIYAKMFQAQKQWYHKEEEGEDNHEAE